MALRLKALVELEKDYFSFLPYGNILDLKNSEFCFIIKNEIMHKFKCFLILCCLTVHLTAQIDTEKTPHRKSDFSFGFAFGTGLLNLKSTDEENTTRLSASLPNIKLGYLIHPRFSLMLQLPGATYKSENKIRGFEGIQLAGQYWATKNLWINAGIGLTLDAPAFFTVDDIESADFYSGLPSLTFGTGYEIYKRGRFTVDLQYRIFYGRSKTGDSSNRQGLSNMFLIGINWY